MAKNVSKYLPLKIVDNFSLAFNWEQLKELYKKEIKSLNKWDDSILDDFPEDKEEFLQEFLKVDYRLKYITDLSNITDLIGCKRSIITFVSKLKRDYEKLKNSNRDKLTEGINYQIATTLPIVLETWSENKQVYKPDVDFLKDLAKTTNFKLHRSDIEHLPDRTFYIDCEGYEDNFWGAFVSVCKGFDGSFFVSIFGVSKNGELRNSNIFIDFDENGVSDIDKQFNNDILEDIAKIHEVLFNRPINLPKQSEDDLQWNTNIRLVLQLMLYLTSKEPDIQESEVTKRTYRKPTGKPQNTFREVQIKDVGIRYGKTIRAFKKEQKKQQHHKEHNANDVEVTIIEGKKRKSPRLHYRSAHWQRYRVGPGRKKVINKWIEPVFVGAGKRTNTDVVIHKVK
jgi:hypothetical protein